MTKTATIVKCQRLLLIRKINWCFWLFVAIWLGILENWTGLFLLLLRIVVVVIFSFFLEYFVFFLLRLSFLVIFCCWGYFQWWFSLLRLLSKRPVVVTVAVIVVIVRMVVKVEVVFVVFENVMWCASSPKTRGEYNSWI